MDCGELDLGSSSLVLGTAGNGAGLLVAHVRPAGTRDVGLEGAEGDGDGEAWTNLDGGVAEAFVTPTAVSADVASTSLSRFENFVLNELQLNFLTPALKSFLKPIALCEMQIWCRQPSSLYY